MDSAFETSEPIYNVKQSVKQMHVGYQVRYMSL